MRQSKKRSDDKAQEDAPDLFADMFDGELDQKPKPNSTPMIRTGPTE